MQIVATHRNFVKYFTFLQMTCRPNTSMRYAFLEQDGHNPLITDLLDSLIPASSGHLSSDFHIKADDHNFSCQKYAIYTSYLGASVKKGSNRLK